MAIQLSGCYNYNTISNSELPLADSSKYPYIIHGQNAKYLLGNIVISNGILSGKINYVEDFYHSGIKINVYITSDSVMKINADSILSVPLDTS